MCLNILAGVIANALFLVATVLVGFTLQIFRRKKLLRFFGIESSKSIVVYLSNIRVIQDGSLGIDGIPRSYQGTTITLGEALQASFISNLFTFIVPSLNNLPGFFRYLLISDIDVRTLPSPLSIDQIDRNSTIITLGSPAYNIVSQYVESQLHPRILFTNGNAQISVTGLPNISNTTQGFLEKVWDADNNRWIFYAAGLSELGTIGSAFYLISRWKQLYGRHSINRFEHVVSINQSNYQEASVII